MTPVLRRIITLVAAFMALSFLVILAGQTVQLAMFAERIHVVAGTVVFWGLLLAYVALIAAPLLLFLRLPRALIPTRADHGPEFEAHLAGLRARLARNPATASSRSIRAPTLRPRCGCSTPRCGCSTRGRRRW